MSELFDNPFKFAKSSIPDKCAGCPVQCESASDLGKLLLVKVFAQNAGLSLMSEEFDQFVADSLPGGLAEEFKLLARSFTSQSIDALDEEISKTQRKMHDDAEVCDGPFNMRATKKGITYTATVCTSPRNYAQAPNNKFHGPAHVQAKPVTDN